MHKHQEGGLLTHRLMALFAAGWLLFSFPLLNLWLSSPAALFAVWAVLIVLLAVMMERGASKERTPGTNSSGPVDPRP
jgi:hypothetical protein